MESCDDEKDGGSENLMPKALSPGVPSGGAKFVDEVLNGQDECCVDNFRMDKNVFYKLCHVLQSRGLLRHTNRIKIEEQLAIFLFITGHNLRTRAVQELFRHYLVDTKSVNLPGFLSPYHDVPYHLNGLPGDRHLQDAKDVFNQWHSLLRNSMNRIFSALKARFPILTSTPPYPLQTQVKLVVAGCAIHNYIHREKPDDGFLEGLSMEM